MFCLVPLRLVLTFLLSILQAHLLTHPVCLSSCLVCLYQCVDNLKHESRLLAGVLSGLFEHHFVSCYFLPPLKNTVYIYITEPLSEPGVELTDWWESGAAPPAVDLFFQVSACDRRLNLKHRLSGRLSFETRQSPSFDSSPLPSRWSTAFTLLHVKQARALLRAC